MAVKLRTLFSIRRLSNHNSSRGISSSVTRLLWTVFLFNINIFSIRSFSMAKFPTWIFSSGSILIMYRSFSPPPWKKMQHSTLTTNALPIFRQFWPIWIRTISKSLLSAAQRPNMVAMINWSALKSCTKFELFCFCVFSEIGNIFWNFEKLTTKSKISNTFFALASN